MGRFKNRGDVLKWCLCVYSKLGVTLFKYKLEWKAQYLAIGRLHIIKGYFRYHERRVKLRSRIHFLKGIADFTSSNPFLCQSSDDITLPFQLQSSCNALEHFKSFLSILHGSDSCRR